jgi:alpha-L-fucosidase 2
LVTRLTVAALPFGEPGQEKISLNVDTLWSGGPFETSVRCYLTADIANNLRRTMEGTQVWINQNR